MIVMEISTVSQTYLEWWVSPSHKDIDYIITTCLRSPSLKKCPGKTTAWQIQSRNIPSIDWQVSGKTPWKVITAMGFHSFNNSQAHPKPKSQKMRACDSWSKDCREAKKENLSRMSVLGCQSKGSSISAPNTRGMMVNCLIRMWWLIA